MLSSTYCAFCLNFLAKISVFIFYLRVHFRFVVAVSLLLLYSHHFIALLFVLLIIFVVVHIFFWLRAVTIIFIYYACVIKTDSRITQIY